MYSDRASPQQCLHSGPPQAGQEAVHHPERGDPEPPGGRGEGHCTGLPPRELPGGSEYGLD